MTPARTAANCSMLFTDLPLLDRPAAAAAAGFAGVEFWWPFGTAAPPDDEVEAFAAAVAGAGLPLVGLNLFAGDMPAGDRGTAGLPGREGEFAASVDIAAALGARLGTGVFNALYGNDGDDRVAEGNLALAVERLPGTVVLEPLSGADRYPLRTAADALAVCDRVPGTALLLDVHHLSVNGDDVAAVIRDHTDRIAHVQVADAPGRHEPGTGSLPIHDHLTALAAAGYGGWVALEYAPTPGHTPSPKELA